MKTNNAKSPRIAIVGAGPIGLEAALRGRLAGFSVNVYEAGNVGANVRDWGHVRLFSPFEMNASTQGRRLVEETQPDSVLPTEGEFLTGGEYAERYLLPLSRTPQLEDVIHEQTTVKGISRGRTWKGDLIGDPARGNDPFRLLLETPDGVQRDARADYVFDCSGVYPHHNWFGAGGLPAVGEFAAADRIDYRLPDILGEARQDFAGKLTLVVGGGYSAATAIVSLADLAETEPDTRGIWLTRGSRTPPLQSIKNDPLPQRRELTVRANQLAMTQDSPIELRAHCLVDEIANNDGQGGLRVSIRTADRIDNIEVQQEQFAVNRIIANVGYRPDRALYEELQVHECYASSGPIKLAAALLGESSDDCLEQSSGGAETLRNPEPGFFILGAKSYGRDSRFLIRTGLDQIRDVYSLVTADQDVGHPR